MTGNEPNYQVLMTNALRELKKLKFKLSEAEYRQREPIAVIGMSCRVPGGAHTLDAFWQLLWEGRDTVTEIPSDRWSLDDLYDEDPQQPGKILTRKGSFLEGVRSFDADFFAISPREAVRLDPQHRMLLETSWEALEHAAINPQTLNGSSTGVFVGICWDDYLKILSALPAEEMDTYAMLGTARSGAAGRIAHFLGLQGPCFVLDTACSSSLVSVHQACESLRRGESEMALAGGVSLMLTPHNTITASRARMISPDGLCKAFDASADGFGRAEGCGMVVLKRLSDAQAAKDPILGLIRGSAINQDGRTSGLTVPNGLSQEHVLRQSLKVAGVAPEQVSYLEAHGTGTSLGDPIEMGAVAQVYCKDRSYPLVVGSLKTNIGHAEGAAGILGLIKIVLMLQHREIPRHLHFNNPSTHIDWSANLEVPQYHRAWDFSQGPRIAAISAFGFTGTNAHAIVEEAPELEEAVFEQRSCYPFTLSARSELALKALAMRYVDFFAGHTDLSLASLSATVTCGRAHMPSRLYLTCESTGQVQAELAQFAKGEPSKNISVSEVWSGGRVRVAVMFTGQGSQYVNMGRELYQHETLFRETLDQCATLLDAEMEKPLKDVLFGDGSTHGLLDQTAFTQPALFALHVSLATLMKSWGLLPSAAVGHSVGEYAAAWLAGVFSLEDGCKLIAARARLMDELPTGGKMVAVFAESDQVVEAVAKYGNKLAIAATNGPAHIVVSGQGDALDALVAELGVAGVKCRNLSVSHAFHSPLMLPMLEAFRRVATEITYHSPSLDLISNISGEIADHQIASADYWVNHVIAEVRFFRGISSLYAQGYRHYVELGPAPILTAMGQAASWPESCHWLPTLRKGKDPLKQLYECLGRLHLSGVPLAWDQVLGPMKHTMLALPGYPFQRQDYWAEASAAPSLKDPVSEKSLRNTPYLDNPLLVLQDHPVKELLRTPGKPTWVAVSQLGKDAELNQQVNQMLARYSMNPGAVSQVTGRAFLFMDEQNTAFSYCNIHRHILVSQVYTGPSEHYETFIASLKAFCDERSLELNILVETEDHRERLQLMDFTSTIFGVWQHLDIESFQLGGNKMRRLRYLIQKFGQLEGVTCREHHFGDKVVDNEILTIIDAWAEAKERGAGALTGYLREAIALGWPGCQSRCFLVRREGLLEGVLMVVPLPMFDSFLMDVEFYRPDVPLGAMEWGIVEIIEILKAEGHHNFTLGLTPFTQLEPHKNEDTPLRDFLLEIHAQGRLNGDANFQFKNKFRPNNTAAYICRPRGTGVSHMTEFLMMMADPTNQKNPVIKRDKQPVPLSVEVGFRMHPLCHHQLVVALSEKIFETHLSLAHLPYLSEHRFGEVTLFPATGFLEMALTAGKQFMEHVTIADFEIGEGLILREEQTHLQLIIDGARQGSRTFRILSRQAEDWRVHASGTFQAQVPRSDLAEFQAAVSRCSEHHESAELYQIFEGLGLHYGPSFQNVQEWWLGSREMVFTVRSPQSLDTGEYLCHPAVLDACLHGCQGLIASVPGDGETYLPLGLSAFSLLEALPAEVRVWARLTAGNRETKLVDLDLFSSQNKRVGSIQGLLLKRAAHAVLGAGRSSILFEPVWHHQERADALQQNGHSLIFADATGVGEAMGLLSGNGTTLVYPGEQFLAIDEQTYEVNGSDNQQIDDLLARVRGVIPLNVVFMWGMDASWDTDQDLCAQLTKTCVELQTLVSSISRSQRKGVRLWIVTELSQAGQGITNSEYRPLGGLWGFARVLARELPDLWAGVIDLGEHQVLDAAEFLLQEIKASDGCREIVWRGGQRLVPQLEELNEVASAPAFSKQGSYLITGGLGGLGLQTASWLASHGAGHLVLVSRRTPGQRAQASIASLEQTGVKITHRVMDITEKADLAVLLDQLQASQHPLKGIFHAAGLIRDGLILGQTPENFETVLRPKVQGAWNLHCLTQGLALDYFVLFSSVTSLLGTVGQVNYAAANDFLDMLAHTRSSQGLAGTSINWGPWSSTGMAAEQGERGRALRQAMGVDDLSPDQAFTALSTILAGNRAQVMVCAFQMANLANSESAQLPILKRLLSLAPKPSHTHVLKTETPRYTLSVAPAPQRHKLLLAYLGERLGQVLGRGQNPPVDRPLNTLGVDSLMVMELRGALKEDFEIELPAVMFFDFPTLAELAEVALEKFKPLPLSVAPNLALDSAGKLADKLARADQTTRTRLVGAFLADCLANVLQRDSASLNLDAPLNVLGVDSLMVMELRNLIKTELDLDLPAVLFFDFPTTNQLVVLVLEKLGLAHHDPPAPSLLDQIALADNAARQPLLLDFLVGCLADILERPNRNLALNAPLNQLGLDSLLVMELRTRIKESLALDLPAVLFFDFPSIQQLLVLVLEKLDAATPAKKMPGVSSASKEPDEINSLDVDNMSEEEVSAMLTQMMTTEDKENP